MTLIEFLLAQIAEDEALVKSDRLDGLIGDTWMNWVLAECKSKRRIVESCVRMKSQTDSAQAWVLANACLNHLLLPYADHPDCREEWKPPVAEPSPFVHAADVTTPAPPTATLAAWLEQQVAADEALATAATAGPWRAVEGASGGWWVELENLADVAIDLHAQNAAHIAAQDPTQTLRRVAAIRQVLALHHSEIEDDPEPYCAGCADEDWPCPTLHALASMFADRDGYRAEEWA